MFIPKNWAALEIVFSDPLISIFERKHSRCDQKVDSIESWRRHDSDLPLGVHPPIVMFLMFLISEAMEGLEASVPGKSSTHAFTIYLITG